MLNIKLMVCYLNNSPPPSDVCSWIHLSTSGTRIGLQENGMQEQNVYVQNNKSTEMITSKYVYIDI